MKVLLPIDGIEDAKLILDFVSKHHWPAGTAFNVLHVIGPCQTDEIARRAELDAAILIKDVSERVEALVSDGRVVTSVRSGSPVYEILDAASTSHISMIIMGYRVSYGMERAVMGSVANGVSIQAPCSVVIIRPGQTKPSKAKPTT